jgi:hypothetical protein
MTDQEINRRIAEFCGWGGMEKYTQEPTQIGDSPEDGKLRRIPSYATDLNAIHEAEKKLTAEQEAVYVEALDRVTWDYIQADARYNAGRLTCSELQFRATAHQRSEALLRTINQWEDEA